MKAEEVYGSLNKRIDSVASGVKSVRVIEDVGKTYIEFTLANESTILCEVQGLMTNNEQLFLEQLLAQIVIDEVNNKITWKGQVLNSLIFGTLASFTDKSSQKIYVDTVKNALYRCDGVNYIRLSYLDEASYKGSGEGVVKQADTLTGLTVTSQQVNNVSSVYTNTENGLKVWADDGGYRYVYVTQDTQPIDTRLLWVDTTSQELKIYGGQKWIIVGNIPIKTISVNGTQSTIIDENVDISIPTKLSQLENDKNFFDNYSTIDCGTF